MKKFLVSIIVILIIIIPNNSYGTINEAGELEEQKSSFKIKDFLNEAQKYSPEFIKELGVNNVFSMATAGKIENKNIFSKIFKLLGKQFTSTLKILVSILAIILIHSLLKALTDGLEQNSVSNIVYYVQYILIVTVIMANFTDVLKNVNDAIENLVGFSYTLIPLLITLILYTGSITTSVAVEPILLFLIEFIARFIKTLIIPAVSIITVLIIISKISDRIQITKIASFMKSSVVWVLGVVLTVFIGVRSLEGTLTSSIDGITAKTTKAAVSSLIPVVR